MKKSKSVKSEHSASSGVSTSNSSDSLNALGIYSRNPGARNPWVNLIVHNIEPNFKELFRDDADHLFEVWGLKKERNPTRT